MKRREFRDYDPGHPARVVLHGIRQIKRGRRPSMPFRNARNPQEAFKFAAIAWCIEIEIEHIYRPTLWREVDYVKPGVYQVDGGLGSDINRVLAAVKQLATAYRTGEVQSCGFTIQCGNPLTLETDFNGVRVHIQHDSDLELLYRDWRRGLSGYIKGIVGPHPKEQLSDEELENDRRIKAEKDEQYRLQQEEWRREREAAEAKLEARLAVAPPFETSNQESWAEYKRKNDDSEGGPLGPGYGARIISFAEEWARLMQAELAEGKTLKDVMGPTADLANYDGITGAMYGAAVHTLAQCWIHGDELRRIHNLKYQIQDEGEQANEEGGTLNPAIITIG